MKTFIKKTKFGFQYRIEGNTGFNYFPDDVKLTPEGMKAYFQRGGRNEPEIVFCNQAGQPAKLYTIKPGEKIAGQRIATVDNDKKFIFNDVTTDVEKLEFLRYYLSEDAEAEKLESDHDKVTAYLKNADEGIKNSFKNMISDKLTPEVMKQQCEKNAKDCYQLPAEIEIIEK